MAGSSPSPFPRSRAIRAQNPVFGDHRLKLGVFAFNQSGTAKVYAPERLVPTWENSRAVGRLADRIGFDALVAVSRWKSYIPGKPRDPSGDVLDPLTWAAAMAGATERAAIFATVHIAAYAPALLAKQAATVDQIAGGRFGINVVAGWSEREAKLLGVTMLKEHEDRYAHAAEWMEIVRRIWTSEDEFDFHGRFFDIEGAYTSPRPAQDPGPVIMNAGGSESGRDFCAAQADIALITVKSDDPQKIADQVESYRSLAREKGRDLPVWSPVAIIWGETDEEAQERRERMHALGDYESARAMTEGVAAAWKLTEDEQGALMRRIVEAGGSFPLVGSPETIVDRLEMLAEAGIDGVLVSWVDYMAGLEHFEAEILPLLEARGLRTAPASRKLDPVPGG